MVWNGAQTFWQEEIRGRTSFGDHGSCLHRLFYKRVARRRDGALAGSLHGVQFPAPRLARSALRPPLRWRWISGTFADADSAVPSLNYKFSDGPHAII